MATTFVVSARAGLFHVLALLGGRGSDPDPHDECWATLLMIALVVAAGFIVCDLLHVWTYGSL